MWYCSQEHQYRTTWMKQVNFNLLRFRSLTFTECVPKIELNLSYTILLLSYCTAFDFYAMILTGCECFLLYFNKKKLPWWINMWIDSFSYDNALITYGLFYLLAVFLALICEPWHLHPWCCRGICGAVHKCWQLRYYTGDTFISIGNLNQLVKMLLTIRVKLETHPNDTSVKVSFYCELSLFWFSSLLWVFLYGFDLGLLLSEKINNSNSNSKPRKNGKKEPPCGISTAKFTFPCLVYC